MHKRTYGPELLIRTPVFLVQYNVQRPQKGGSHAEAELVALEWERQNSRLWRNGEDGGRCLGRCRISGCPAGAFRASLKVDCYRVGVGVLLSRGLRPFYFFSTMVGKACDS